MSVTDRADATGVPLEELPEFDLSCLFDDREEPTEVTVFPDSDRFDISTHWITTDVGSAISIEEVR